MAVKKTTRIKKPTNPYASFNRTIHIFSAILFAAFAVITGLLVEATQYPLSLSFTTKDSLLSQQETVYASAERVVVEPDIKWLLVGLFSLAAIYSLLVVTRWAKSYQQMQLDRVYFWRWVFIGVGAALLVTLVSIVSGVEDIVTIKLSAVLSVLAACFAWFCERQNQKANKPIWSAYILAVVAMLGALLPIISSLAGTALYGLVTLPRYIYFLSLLTVLASCMIGSNLMWYVQKGSTQPYGKIERNYAVMCLIIKVALAVIVLTSLR